MKMETLFFLSTAEDIGIRLKSCGGTCNEEKIVIQALNKVLLPAMHREIMRLKEEDTTE